MSNNTEYREQLVQKIKDAEFIFSGQLSNLGTYMRYGYNSDLVAAEECADEMIRKLDEMKKAAEALRKSLHAEIAESYIEDEE